MKRFPFLVCLLFITTPLFGQNARTLTLQESIDLAQAQSPAAAMARLDFTQSQWGYRAYRAQYKPSLSLRGDAPGFRRSIQDVVQDDGSVRYVEQNRTDMRAIAAVSQPIPMTGGTVFFNSGLSRLNNELGDNAFTQWQSTPLIVGFNQPLMQFNEMKWERRIEPLRYTFAERTYVENLEAVSLDITRRFFDVYIAEMNRDIATFNVAINDTVFALSQGRFDIGRIAENDLLQSELQLLNAQSDASNARIAYQEALQDLKLALDLPYDAELKIVPPEDIPDVRIDPNEAVAQARRNRPAFLNLDIQNVEAERELARAKRNNSFSADLTASYGLNQSAPAFDGAYNDPLNQQALSVSFSVPVFNWGQNKAQVQAAVAAQERVAQNTALQQKELEQEVYFEALQLEQLQQQALIAAKADTVAARRFEVAKNRYLIGKIDITELFNAQREKDTARRSYVQTLQQFWTSYFNLRRLTLYDFVRNQSLTGRVQ
jgi:outer membrane protein TolC